MDKANVFIPLVCLILFMTVVSAALLGLRQNRIEATHDIAVLHREITQTRFTIWDLQERVARRLNPERLRGALSRVHPDLEPLILDPGYDRPAALAAAGIDHRGSMSNQ